MISVSPEQQEIIDAVLSRGKNVMVNSVAGSGKTTTCLNLALQARTKRWKILLLTYNASLKLETRERAAVYGLRLNDELEVHSYHAMGYKYYNQECCTDDGLRKALKFKQPPSKTLPRYDVVIMDEAQDQCPIYFEFVCKLMKDISGQYGDYNPLLLIVGQAMQCVNRWNGSDARFLTLAEQLYGSRWPWCTLRLKTSYRVTGNIARFVNEVMLGPTKQSEHMLVSKEDGDKVDYFVGNNWKAAEKIAEEIVRLCREKGVPPSDIMVLAPSVKSARDSAPVKKLENKLVESGLSVHVTYGDKGSVDIAKGKILLTTYNQAKGLERPYVYVFNFSLKYFELYNKDGDRYQCPCVLYVAATRALKYLCVVAESVRGEHLPFLDMPRLECMRDRYQSSDGKQCPPAVRVRGNYIEVMEKLPKPVDAQEIQVGELTAYLPELILTQIMEELEKKRTRHMRPQGSKYEICVEVDTANDLKEQVSDINGLAIPAMLEVEVGRAIHGDEVKCAMYTHLQEYIKEEQCPKEIKSLFMTCDPPKTMQTIESYLRLATLYNAAITEYISKAISLFRHTSFDWIAQELATSCMEKLKRCIGIDACEHVSFEKDVYETLDRKGKAGQKIILKGLLDIVTSNAVYEIKCVREFNPIHFIQIYLYSWLWMRTNRTPHTMKFYLFNVLSEETWEVFPPANLEAAKHDFILNILLDHYFDSEGALTDENFLLNNRPEEPIFGSVSSLQTISPVGIKRQFEFAYDTGIDCQSSGSRDLNDTSAIGERLCKKEKGTTSSSSSIVIDLTSDDDLQELGGSGAYYCTRGGYLY